MSRWRVVRRSTRKSRPPGRERPPLPEKGPGSGKLKVVISGHETCGIIHDLAEELRSRGHEVTTIALANSHFPYEYDYDQYVFPVSYARNRFGGGRVWSKALGTLWRISPRAHELLEKAIRVRLVRSADIYVRVWATIPLDAEVLADIDRTKTKVATMLMGSDVRNYRVFAKQYDMEIKRIDAGENDPPQRTKLTSLRTHEKFADAIFSLPDQMGLALRPYHHFQVPLRLESFRFNVPGRRIPKVVHAPTRPGVKGTDTIEAALNSLKAEGVDFEFTSIRSMPHDQLLEILSDADVLVDELIVHGPGWLSFEAMASGTAVATRYLKNSPTCFRPPVVAIDEDNIEDQLRILLTDQSLRIRLAEEGRRYVETNNRISDVVDDLLRKTSQGKSAAPDYVPNYLLENYEPFDSDDAALINELNSTVQDEDWYRQLIAGRSRAGINF